MRLCILGALAGAMLVAGLSLATDQPFNGRWDLTVSTPQESYPSWMEVTQDGTGANVKVVGRVASVHPAKDVKVEGSRLSFTSTEHFGKPIQVTWVFNAVNGRLTGTQKREDGVLGRIVGQHAPALDRKPPSAWSTPEKLFDGKDLTGWLPDKPSENHWKAINGELVNESPGANIRTARKFEDYKLHIEYNCPKEGNSGIYQRGRYEVQVAYEPPGTNDKLHGMGAIYGFIAPAVDLPEKPGQWETFDITLVGRHVTVVRDGVTTIDNQEIPGITGGALDSHEALPNSLYIQGDHTGGMKYRNITISVPKR
jgi:Domain of Unknown Function (DUF1080)